MALPAGDGRFCEALYVDVAVVDHWECDRAAIGLERGGAPGRLAYVAFTPGHVGGAYQVELEEPAVSGSELPYQPAGGFSNLDADAAIAVVSKHLQLMKREARP